MKTQNALGLAAPTQKKGAQNHLRAFPIWVFWFYEHAPYSGAGLPLQVPNQPLVTHQNCVQSNANSLP